MRPFFLNRFVIGFSLIILLMAVSAWFFVNIFIYIVLSLVLATILKVPTNYLSSIQLYSIRVPRVLATLISFSLVFGLIFLFIYLFVPLITSQAETISAVDFDSWVSFAIEPLTKFEAYLLDNKLVSEKKGFILESFRNTLFNLLKSVQISSFLNNLVSVTSTFLIGFMAVLFITFFFLYEKGLIKKYVIALIPNKYFEVSIVALSKTERMLSNYLLGLLLQMVSIFTLASFGLLLVGVEYAVTIAVFAAVSNLIPYLGPILGTVFGVVVGITTNPEIISSGNSVLFMSKVLGVFAFVQVVDNLLLQPIIFSKSVKAHPLEIFLIVFVGANLGQIPGMIVAIPFYTIFKVSFVEFYKGYRNYQVFRN